MRTDNDGESTLGSFLVVVAADLTKRGGRISGDDHRALCDRVEPIVSALMAQVEPLLLSSLQEAEIDLDQLVVTVDREWGVAVATSELNVEAEAGDELAVRALALSAAAKTAADKARKEVAARFPKPAEILEARREAERVLDLSDERRMG